MVITYNNKKLEHPSFSEKAVKLLSDGKESHVTSTLDEKLNLATISKDEELTLVDLEANGQFQMQITPSKLADFLVKSGLPKTIKMINLLISDIPAPSDPMILFSSTDSPERSGMCLGAFGQRLADLLVNDYGYNPELSVCDTSNLGSKYVVVQPPELETQKWKVHGITDISSDIHPNYKTLIAYDKKKLLWEGTHIHDWLHQSQRISRATVASTMKFEF